MKLDWLIEGLEKPGKSQVGLAQFMGWHESTVSRLVAGKRQLKAHEEPKIREYLETPSQGHPAVANARRATPQDLFGGTDLPIYASAEGGGTGMTISYDPIEYVIRPAPLVGVKGAFGFYVIGDSMEPLFRPGWIVLVHPVRPPQKGDPVLVTLRSADEMTHEALVKIYEGWKDDKLILSQLNPRDKLKPIARERVQSVQQIVGTYFGR